jgi:hypothetical protein
MATGCYPIQTNTSCADEWLRATSGSIVPSASAEVIAKELLTALKSDEHVDFAVGTNKKKIEEFASKAVVLHKASAFYSAVL